MNGLAEFYREEDAKEIKRLQDEVKAKDEKIRLERICGIKEIMSSFGVNFDIAFDTLKIDSSLKEEYRRLVEEK